MRSQFKSGLCSRSTLWLFLLVVLLCWCPPLTRADDARTVIVDSVSRGHQEAVPPNPEEHPDEGPIVESLSDAHSPLRHDLIKPGGHDSRPERFQIAAVDFSHVSTPYIIALWIIIVGLAKICFHVTPKISIICPESCVLMVVGVIIGLLLFYTGINRVGPLTPDVFFLYMLPPIVMDAGYHMPNRLFFDNLTSILMYAVIGTVWNALLIGLSLWGIGLTGFFGVEMPLLDTLLFSSVVSAVDPVAVLAVFEEIQVNEVLYILVFGESLLNDAVTVVLYHMFEGYTMMGVENLIPIDYAAGVASFFVVALGGTCMGIVWGFLAAFISRFTHHVRTIEPLFVFVMAYLSYLSAELFKLSGIMALTFCGITMKNYVEENISQKSHTVVKYTMKMLANSAESIIFLFLGVCTVNDSHDWNTWFVVLTIFFCLFYRTLGVILLTALANRFRLHRLNKVEQFIMAYGGLRGAVAFALVLIVSEQVIPTKKMMVTTIIAIVYFTVFLQGMTVGPLVKILKVRRANKIKLSMNERIHTRLIDHLMAGIEDVSGHPMGNYHIRDKFKYYNNKFIRPLLLRESALKEPKIVETYSKLNVSDAMNLVKQNSTLVPMMGSDNNISLSALLRTYTQANLTKLYENSNATGSPAAGVGGGAGFTRNDSSFLNFDMGELEYCPSSKDLADAEIHHILSDSMFKPVQRYRRYSRDLIPESTYHPPFHHHMRMQIRRMVSSGGRHHKRSGSSHSHRHNRQGSSRSGQYLCPDHRPNGYLHPNGDVRHKESSLNDPDKPHQATTLRFHLSPPEEEPPMYKDLAHSQHSLAEIPDDEGIIFVARPSDTPAPDANDGSSRPSTPPLPRTLTESTLPWKRSSESPENDALRQREFPSWIENKEYLTHASPTSTLLTRITEDRPRKIFEIFELQKVDEVPPSEEQKAEEEIPPPPPPPPRKDSVVEAGSNSSGVSPVSTVISVEHRGDKDHIQCRAVPSDVVINMKDATDGKDSIERL